MDKYLIILLLLNIASIILPTSSSTDGYYWRDYSGHIPLDAFQGASDINGKPIYIGQVLYLAYLVPAKIYTDNKISFEHSRREITTSSSIKILCSKFPEYFEWIATNNDAIRLLGDKHLVIGGYFKPGTITYIGRKPGNAITLGKILIDISGDAGLYITRNGSIEKHTSYEVLAFNPNYLHKIDTRFTFKP